MPSDRKRLVSRLATVILSVSLVAGCATGTNPRDPYEKFNRGVYGFNEDLDNLILKPVAGGYRAILPQFVRTSVSNFFANISDVVVAFNNLLQGKFVAAVTDLGRVGINSTIGLGGLFDIASAAGIEKHDEDFGQTLGKWGVADGPFIMLPFFGPSNGRDVAGRVVDLVTDPITYVDPSSTRTALWGTRVVNRRSELLDATTVLQTAALDPYEFVRDAYLQRRRNLIYDGAPPPDKEFMDLPPAPKTSNPAPYPVAGEPTGAGSILVSQETGAPVQTVLQAETDAVAARQSTRQSAQPAPTRLAALSTSSIQVSGQWDAFDKSQVVPSPLTESKPKPQRVSLLTRIWRSLAVSRAEAFRDEIAH